MLSAATQQPLAVQRSAGSSFVIDHSPLRGTGCNVGPREAQVHGAVRDRDAHEHCFVTIIDLRDL